MVSCRQLSPTKQHRPPSSTDGRGGELALAEDAGAEGWELFAERGVGGGEPGAGGSSKGDRDWSYLNEKDATDVSVLNVCSEGVIRHPPAAVLKVCVRRCVGVNTNDVYATDGGFT